MPNRSIWFVVLTAVLLLVASPASAQRASEEEPEVVHPKLNIVLVKGAANADRIRAEQAAGGTKPIYGLDDRMDWGAIETSPNALVKRRARASVALFLGLAEAPHGSRQLKAKTNGEVWSLCKDERFAGQLAGAFCSGTLIGDDLVLTAGHCVREVAGGEDAPPVKDILFVFGYTASGPKDPGRTEFPPRQVYRGSAKVDGALKNAGGDDWAIVRLDRRVPRTVAEPVREWRKARIPNGRRVFVIGFPSGLPLKYAAGASVTKNKARAFFVANLDTFGGNSGSGVYDDATGELAGVLARGDTDYYWDQASGCSRAYRCPVTGCAGEDVTRIEIVRQP